jgi:2'-5' RNA ligase
MNTSLKFDYDTYVVLDLPEPIAAQIVALRHRQHDWLLNSLPAEITVAGSSGVDPFDPEQDPDPAFRTLDAIAANTAPLQASFGTVLCFPNTDIFVFTFQDEAPFRALHERIATSGLLFQPSKFPYKPHCTLRRRSPVTEEEIAELMSLRLAGTFTLDTMSVYMWDRLPLTLLHRVKLSDNAHAER